LAQLGRFYGKRGDDVVEANRRVIAAAYDGVIDVSEALGLPHGIDPSPVEIGDGPRALVGAGS
jgi:hypothetical protein